MEIVGHSFKEKPDPSPHGQCPWVEVIASQPCITNLIFWVYLIYFELCYVILMYIPNQPNGMLNYFDVFWVLNTLLMKTYSHIPTICKDRLRKHVGFHRNSTWWLDPTAQMNHQYTFADPAFDDQQRTSSDFHSASGGKCSSIPHRSQGLSPACTWTLLLSQTANRCLG